MRLWPVCLVLSRRRLDHRLTPGGALRSVVFPFRRFWPVGPVVAFWFYLTGGLHADGYMDTADGLFSGRSRERMLEILKDSRVGAGGVTAFVFLVLLKVAFLSQLTPDAALPASSGSRQQLASGR